MNKVMIYCVNSRITKIKIRGYSILINVFPIFWDYTLASLLCLGGGRYDIYLSFVVLILFYSPL